MGNNLCCNQKGKSDFRIKISSSQKIQSDLKNNYVVPQTSCTSDSEGQNKILPSGIAKPYKSDNFRSFIKQRQFQMSSIKKISQSYESCCEQKLIISYLQKLEVEMENIKRENDPKKLEILIDREQKYKLDQKIFIQHSSKCPICYQLFQNLKNIENHEFMKTEETETGNRISLRDSLLQFQQCQKAKRCEQCKFQALNNHQQAKKALKKFPNTNKYQSKRLKFRKTSLFEPQIKEARQSQQSAEA